MNEHLDINNFEKPTEHPYGMLNIKHANENEHALASILWKAVDVSSFDIPIPRKNSHSSLVNYGYLTGNSKDGYLLTDKAKAQLYPYYKKE